MASPGSRNRLPSMLSLSLAAHLLALALIPVSGPVARLRQEVKQHLSRTTVRFERIEKTPEKPKAVAKRPRPKPVMRAHRRVVRHVRRARRVRRAPVQRHTPQIQEPTQVALAPTPDTSAPPSVELAAPEPAAVPEPPPAPEPDLPTPEPERPGLPARSAPQLADRPAEGADASVGTSTEATGPVAATPPLPAQQAVPLPTTAMSHETDAAPGQSAGALASLPRAAPTLPGAAGSGPAGSGTGPSPQAVSSDGPLGGIAASADPGGVVAGLPQLLGGADVAGLPGPGPGGGERQLPRAALPGLAGGGQGPPVSLARGTGTAPGRSGLGSEGSGPVAVRIGADGSDGGSPQVAALGGEGGAGGGGDGPGGANAYGLSYGRSAAIMRSLAELAGGGSAGGGGRGSGRGLQSAGAGEGPVALGQGSSSGAGGSAGVGFGPGSGDGPGAGDGSGDSSGPGAGGGGTGSGRGRSEGPLLAALPGIGSGSGPGGGSGAGTGTGPSAGTGGGAGGGPVRLVFGGVSGGSGGAGLPGSGMGSGSGGYGSGPGTGGGGGGTALGRFGPALTAVLLGPVGLGLGGGGGAGQGGVGGSGDGGLGGPVAIGGGTGGGGFGVPALPTMGSWSSGVAGTPGPGGAAGALQRPASGTGEGPGGLYVGVSGSFDMPMGVTSSDYDTDIAGMPNLLGEVRKRTNVHVTVLQRTVKLDPEELKHTPVLHLRGHRPFTFSPQEREALRQYVAQGGTILAEDSHGPFGECFRREMRLIFSQPLRDLPMTHDIYRAHYVLKSVPAGDMGERYPLQGVEVGGRLGVIYSRNDYGDCWEGTGAWVKAESREPAFQMGANLFVYIVAHWNKRKQP